MTPRPARLLWLVDSLGMGGAESLTVPFVTNVDRTRFEVFVACLARGGVQEHALRDAGIEPVNLHARNLTDRAAFRRLVHLIREQQIDLIHAHLAYANMWAALASRRTGIPSIASLHVAPSATIARKEGLAWRVMTHLRDRIMCVILNRWASAIVTVSAALRDTYDKALRKDKVKVVHNGIDVSRFRSAPPTPNAQRPTPTFVTVAVLRPAKGIEVLLEAMRHVEGTLLIVGDGPKREEWTQLANSLGIGDKIQWLGFRTDVETVLPQADAFVHPSLDDAFPTVLLEAMAAGLPVIASKVGGIPEIVVDGVTGHLVPPGDATALARAMQKDCSGMGAAGRARAEQLFSTNAWLARLTALYDEVLAR